MDKITLFFQVEFDHSMVFTNQADVPVSAGLAFAKYWSMISMS